MTFMIRKTRTYVQLLVQIPKTTIHTLVEDLNHWWSYDLHVAAKLLSYYGPLYAHCSVSLNMNYYTGIRGFIMLLIRFMQYTGSVSRKNNFKIPLRFKDLYSPNDINWDLGLENWVHIDRKNCKTLPKFEHLTLLLLNFRTIPITPLL
jgi:hypothetical protein